jgi:GxxExxY protein
MNIREITYTINGAIFEVHKALGSGFLEKVYENALLIELELCGLKATSQVAVNVSYKEHIVGEYIADIIVEDTVVLELKAVEDLTRVHQAQLFNYLKASGKPVGILANFKGEKAVIRRLGL